MKEKDNSVTEQVSELVSRSTRLTQKARKHYLCILNLLPFSFFCSLVSLLFLFLSLVTALCLAFLSSFHSARILPRMNI